MPWRITQNSNESFNSLVWSIAAKSKSNGKTIVDIACDFAVSIFDGFTSILEVMQVVCVRVCACACACACVCVCVCARAELDNRSKLF